MSEETPQATDNGADNAADSTDSVTWENSPIAKIYNPDGSPRPDAAESMSSLGHEELAGFTLRNGQDFFTTLKTGKDAVAFASQKHEGIKMPGEDAGEDEWKAFNKSLGALESADDYKAQMWPDDLPEDFQKDEGLGSILAEHAAKSPVMTPDAVKSLVTDVVAYQKEQGQNAQEAMIKGFEEEAQATKDALTVEIGGTERYAEFSNDVREFAVKDLSKLGFEFQLAEDGKTLLTDNPAHAAMLRDAPMLRLIKSVIDAEKPATIPSDSANDSTSTDSEAKRQELWKKHQGNWPDQKTYDEYRSYVDS